jgi:hypothetical protein
VTREDLKSKLDEYLMQYDDGTEIMKDGKVRPFLYLEVWELLVYMLKELGVEVVEK